MGPNGFSNSVNDKHGAQEQEAAEHLAHQKNRRLSMKVEITSVAVVTKNRLFFENISGVIKTDATEVRMVRPDDQTLLLGELDADIALVDVDTVPPHEYASLSLTCPAAAVGVPERGRVYECIRHGLRDFVSKPVDNERLLEALQRTRLAPTNLLQPTVRRDREALEGLALHVSNTTGLPQDVVREFVFATSFACMPGS